MFHINLYLTASWKLDCFNVRIDETGELENATRCYSNCSESQVMKQDPGSGFRNPLTFICYVILDNSAKPLLLFVNGDN